MKKIFTLGLMFLSVSLSALAQDEVDNSLQFETEDGTVVNHGSVLYLTEPELNDFDQWQVSSGLFVHNVSGSNVAVNVGFEISSIPTGDLQCCYPSNCQVASEIGEFATTSGVVSADDRRSFLTEWVIGEEKAYGDCTVTFTLQMLETGFDGRPGTDVIGYGPQVTVHFVSPDPAGINDATVFGVQDVTSRYDALGRCVSAPVKGLNIVKLADGKTVKQILK